MRTLKQIYIQGYGGLVYLGGLKDTELYNLIQANIKGFGLRGAGRENFREQGQRLCVPPAEAQGVYARPHGGS